jgi:gamma-glutamylcyclotransferase
MLSARLQARCPSAKAIGIARAAGYALEFTKPGRDMSGKATLVDGDTGASTPGVLFEIARSDLPNLDEVEGNGYRRHDRFAVELNGTDDQVYAVTYLAFATDPHLRPFDWYLALVIAGAIQNRLDERHVKGLREIEYIRDVNLDNKWRTEALRAFAREGISDYEFMLK